jgi:hypothetical protein
MIRSVALVSTLCLLVGCSSVTVDQMRLTETNINLDSDTVVVLGRQHSPAYEAEGDLVTCVANELSQGAMGMEVIPDGLFVDALYPWFEPRTAPLSLARLETLLEQQILQQAIDNFEIRYIIWIEGNTETTDSSGGLSCTISPAGGGCLGLGMWEDESTYEASVWDFHEMRESGRISVDSHGTSYLPAVIIPFPLLARVQTNSCKGLGKQIQSFIVQG